MNSTKFYKIVEEPRHLKNFDLWDLGLLNIDSPGLEAKPQGVDRRQAAPTWPQPQMLQAAGLAGETLGFTSCHVASKLLILAYLGKTCLHFWDDMQNDHGCQPLTCVNWHPGLAIWGRHPTSGVAAILSWRKTRLRAAIVCKEEASTDLPTLERLWNRIKNLRTLLLLQGPR